MIKLDLLPWLLLTLVALLAAFFWIRMDSLSDNLSVAKSNISAMQDDLVLNNKKLAELAETSKTLRYNYQSLSKKAKELEKENEDVKAYLSTPVPPESASLLNEARRGKAAK